MRGVLVLLAVMMAPIDAAQQCTPRETLERDPAVTIQIHDYEHLPGEWLSRAGEIVSRTYADSGIRTEWRGALRQNVGRTHSAARPGPRDVLAAKITIIILTPEMAARGRIPGDVLGYAAVPHEGGMGRIAYAIYDRIRRVAADSRANEVELLAFVIAHETGHLLLGRGSGTETGLMKCHWDRRGMQQLDAPSLGFSELQAARIRNTLMNGSPPVMAANGSPGAAGTCATSAGRRSR